ncbi:UNVERIFIED_CONTAM: putative disease resistance protein RGA3 [Sesamum calycinum]|uniref:Disease resistance protein RGA3 n=1 Tax=Sesamum calycinum TaxID=2727403 RepID=A0AAW2PRC0_9LAMI
MAEIILAPLLQVIFDKIADPVLQEFSDYFELDDQFKKLQRILPMAQAVIQDAEERQATDKAVRLWLSELKDATSRVEDLIEEFTYRQKGGRYKSYAVNFSKNRRVLDDLQEALVEGLKLPLAERNVAGRKLDTRETSSFFVVSEMVYNDDEVKRCFDLRIWVYVSPDFKVKRIIKAAIETATGSKCDLEELDALQLILWDILHKRKFLLVLGDVWNEDEDEWDKLMPLFSYGFDGSRILVTTRSQKIAMIIGPSNRAYHLKGLCEEDCWALFRKRAFLDQLEEENHPNLVVVGKELVKKCRGLPLAAKVLGGLMRFKKEETDWLHVQNSDLWNLRHYRHGVFPALLEDYYPHVDGTWVYPLRWRKQGVGRYRERVFNELLWMSVFEEIKECEGGPVRGYKTNETFYNLARFMGGKELLVLEQGLGQNSVRQVRHASVLPEYSYRPPLIPEALCLSKHLRTLLVFSEGGLPTAPSHIFSSFVYLRVLKLSGCHTELPASVVELSLLRYLDLSNSHFHSLPSGISSLCSLQVLNLLGCYNLKFLPPLSRITGLRHLEISGCEALTEIPYGIRNLVYLQTLPIYIVPKNLPQFRVKDLRFKNLQLNIQTDSHLIEKIELGSLYELQHLDLRGGLKIKHLEHVRDVEEAKAANLISKAHLNSLGLCWGHEGSDFIMNPALGANAARFQEEKPLLPGPAGPSDPEDPEACASASDPHFAAETMASLEPHKNLKNLFVVGYPGFKFPCWNLPNLIKVVLINCEGCVDLPILGHLPLLKSLHMEGMSKITFIGEEFYGDDVTVISFPSLQELFMGDFASLREWSSPDGKETFPKLSKLILRNCQNLVSFPSFMPLKHLELHNCNSAILTCMEELSQLTTLVPHHSLVRGAPNAAQGFQNLTGLESLEISDCHSLITLSEKVIGHLRSLQTLSIENCSSLTSISIGSQHLTSLEYLAIMYCPSLAAFPDNPEHLSALKSLAIISCPLIEFLPDGIKHAIALRSLEIRSCPRMTELPEWLGNFAALRTLAISDCQNLKTLPIAIRRLSQLQHLSIQDCPRLQGRCQEDRGEDWWKISHVPYRYIATTNLD